MIIGAAGQPRGDIGARQPSTPPILEHLTEIDRIDRHRDAKCDQNAENAELTEEFSAIKCLERIVKGSVPFIDSDADEHITEGENDNPDQQTPCRPFLFG
jgi:hypothetical protein